MERLVADSPPVSAAQAPQHDPAADHRDRRITAMLTAPAPGSLDPGSLDDETLGTVARQGLLIGRATWDHLALDQMPIDGENDVTHGISRGAVLERLDDRIDDLQVAISYGRASSSADVLTQAIVSYQSAERIDDKTGLSVDGIEAVERVKRIALSIAAYAAAAGGLDPANFGASYLMPRHADRLAPNYLERDIARHLGRAVVDPSAGAGTFIPQSKDDGILPLIAAHRHAANHLSDANDRMNFALAAAAETAAFNALFSVRPSTTADLLALLRHVQRHVEDSTGNAGSISLRDLVSAIGDAVEGLRSASSSGSLPSSPDAFLLDLTPTLVPLLDEADLEWAKASALYEKAEEIADHIPDHEKGVAHISGQSRFDRAMVESGYIAATEITGPLFERLEVMVGPFMDVPVQTFDGLLLKHRIGHTLEHFKEHAADDLAKLARARFGYTKKEIRS